MEKSNNKKYIGKREQRQIVNIVLRMENHYLVLFFAKTQSAIIILRRHIFRNICIVRHTSALWHPANSMVKL